MLKCHQLLYSYKFIFSFETHMLANNSRLEPTFGDPGPPRKIKSYVSAWRPGGLVVPPRLSHPNRGAICPRCFSDTSYNTERSATCGMGKLLSQQTDARLDISHLCIIHSSMTICLSVRCKQVHIIGKDGCSLRCCRMECIELKRSSQVQIHEPLILIQSNPSDDPESESSPVQNPLSW